MRGVVVVARKQQKVDLESVHRLIELQKVNEEPSATKDDVERLRMGKRSASVNAKLGKSIDFGCILGVLVSLLKHQRDEGHIKRARAEHERAIGLTSTGMNGNSNNRRMWDVDFRSSGAAK